MGNDIPIIILLALTLGGCAASQAPLPDDNYYRLAALIPATNAGGSPGVNTGLNPAAKPPINGLLMVEELDSDALHGERALLYSDDPGHRQLRRDHYNYWSDAPPRLIQGILVARLRAAGLARQTLHYSSDIQADTLLSGRVQRFEQLIDGERARVIVAVELQLLDSGAPQPRRLTDYREEVILTDTSTAAAIGGFEQALNHIIDRFISDILADHGSINGR